MTTLLTDLHVHTLMTDEQFKSITCVRSVYLMTFRIAERVKKLNASVRSMNVWGQQGKRELKLR